MTTQTIPRTWLYAGLGMILLLVVNHFIAAWISQHTKSQKTNWLIAQGPHQTDVVVLGSSAALASIDTPLLAKELGQDVFNLAEAGAAFTEQALVWELYLESSSCQTLILEVDAWGVSNRGYSWPFHEYNFLAFLDHPSVEKAVVEQTGFWRTMAWKYVPMLKFSEYNNQLGLSLAGSCFKGTLFNPRKNSLSEGVMSAEKLAADKKYWSTARWEWEQSRIVALRQILARAKQQGIQTVMYYSPIYEQCEILDEPLVIEFYRKLAAEMECELVILNDESLTGKLANFTDATHMNAQGAALWTTALAQRIKELPATKKD